MPRPEQPQPPKSKKMFVLTLLGIFVLGGGILGSQSLRQINTIVPAPSLAPLPSSSPAIIEKTPQDYKIIVQNGTKTAGLAAEYQIKLASAGFTQVEISNAKEVSLTTKVTTSTALPNTVQQLILDTLKPRVPEIVIAEIDTNLINGDIVILLGSK